MLKLLNTSVAKLVGATSAVVFQHICYWMQTQSKETIYRTNKQLSEDLDGIYSPQQIQRAKKKLIEEGLIVVTADKRDAWNRTSHYSLTDKGRSLLLSVNRTDNNTTKGSSKNTSKTLADASQNRADSTKEAKTYTKLSENKQAKYERSSNSDVTTDCSNTQQVVCKSNNALEHNSAMRESFKEGFSNANAVPMPDNLKSLFKREQKHNTTKSIVVEETIETQNIVEKHNQQEWEDVVKAEMEILSDDVHADEQYISQDEYNECEIAMLQSIETTNQSEQKHLNSPSITFAELMKTAYNKATTEAQEQMYRMKKEMQQYKYCEDF